jgi:hypothetical protein
MWVWDMARLYGNLADAALGERRVAQCVREKFKFVAQTRVKPATRMLVGLGLTCAGLIALAVLGYAPDRFAAATPVIADLEDWLMWRDLQSF